MSSHRSTARRPILLGGTVTAALVALAALLAFASPAAAQTIRECTNAAWADYNSCLMETDSWWVRKGCDLAFEVEYTRCWAAAYHDIVR